MGLKRLVRSKRGKPLSCSSSEPSAVATRCGTSPSSSSKTSRDRTSSGSSAQPPLATASTIVFGIPGLRDEVFTFHAYDLMRRYWKLTRPGQPLTQLALLRAHLELWHVKEELRLWEDWILAKWWPMPRPKDSTHETLHDLNGQQAREDPEYEYKRTAARISTYRGRRRYQRWYAEWGPQRVEPDQDGFWNLNGWHEFCRRQLLLSRERPRWHRADLDEVLV